MGLLDHAPQPGNVENIQMQQQCPPNNRRWVLFLYHKLLYESSRRENPSLLVCFYRAESFYLFKNFFGCFIFLNFLGELALR